MDFQIMTHGSFAKPVIRIYRGTRKYSKGLSVREDIYVGRAFFVSALSL